MRWRVVAGLEWVDGMFAVLLAVVSMLSAARLVVAWRGGDRTGVVADGAHLLMGIGMVAMFLPWADPVPRLVWIVVFVAAGAWFTAYLLRGTGPGRRAHHAHMLIATVAMVYMFAVAVPTPQPDPVVALPATGSVVLAHDHSGGANLAAAALLLAGYFIGQALWSARRTVRVDPTRSSGWSALAFARLAESGHVVMGLAMSYMLTTMAI
jgi:hypothetical protein